MPTPSDLFHIAIVGAGATALLDAWLLLLQRLGVPTGSFALVGRWVGHMARGRFVHAAIARSEPLAQEATLGWAVHYAVGIAFAALLVAQQGVGWLHQPSWGPALVTGVVSVVMPLCVMQPAMGAGFASSRTATPWRNRLRGLVNHAVFGVGLYGAAAVVAMATR